MYNVHLQPLFAALFVQLFSLFLWLLVGESPKCHQVPEAFRIVFVVNICERPGGKLFDKRVRFQKVSQIGGICLQGVFNCSS